MLSEISQKEIAYNLTYEWNLKNIKSKQTKQKQTHSYREQVAVARWDGCWGRWVEKVKGLRSTHWWIQNSHRDVKYTMRTWSTPL